MAINSFIRQSYCLSSSGNKYNHELGFPLFFFMCSFITPPKPPNVFKSVSAPGRGGLVPGPKRGAYEFAIRKSGQGDTFLRF